jgi:predicted MFS family arabinose efflux permease
LRQRKLVPDNDRMSPYSRPTEGRLLALAMALSLTTAVALGVTRFAYALLLPPMRADLQWSYTLAGAMNTANAAGYLAGALLTPRLLRAIEPARLLVAGCLVAGALMGLTGFLLGPGPLLLQRVLAGAASAVLFVAGSVLAARLGSLQPARGGLLLGLYYGGTGLGIVLSALAVPALLHVAGDAPHGWARAWWVLGAMCIAAAGALAWPARALREAPVPSAPRAQAVRFRWPPFAPALAAYFMFGLGYIGYMTFVIALLREEGEGVARITFFFALLGVAVMASSRIWAGLLDRHKGGQALAILSALLAAATVLPALTNSWPLVLLSGAVFGGVFLSLVASTTALVRHNLPSGEWAAGIGAFTIVFALGQILGPTVVGWIADGPGGLARGLMFSAAALAAGALLASRQRPTTASAVPEGA